MSFYMLTGQLETLYQLPYEEIMFRFNCCMFNAELVASLSFEVLLSTPHESVK